MLHVHVQINVVYFIIIIINIYRTPTPLFRSQSTLLQSLVSVPGLSIFIISFSHVGSSICSLYSYSPQSLLPSLPPSPPPSLPQVWSVDSYQLWLLPRGEQLFQHSKLVDPTPAGDGSGSDGKVLIAGSHLVVINFVKSSFINNPVTVSILIINNNTCLL